MDGRCSAMCANGESAAYLKMMLDPHLANIWSFVSSSPFEAQNRLPATLHECPPKRLRPASSQQCRPACASTYSKPVIMAGFLTTLPCVSGKAGA